MGELPQTAASQTIFDHSEPLLCPFCGYDLRRSPGEICSECGHTIDRSTLSTSNFPWPHRRHLGRIRTFWKTVFLITINSKQLRYESARTQLLSDGRAFRKAMAATLATALISIWIILIVANHGPDFLAVHRPSNLVNSPPQKPLGQLQDLAVPWSTAATMLPTWPLMLTFLAIYLTGIQQRLFRLKDASPQIQNRALTIGYYSTAPLALVFPAILPWAATLYLFVGQMPAITTPNLITAHSPLLLVILIPPLTLIRIIQWNLRITHRGSEHALYLMPKILALYLLGLILFLGILPWCIGFLWLVIDSFR